MSIDALRRIRTLTLPPGDKLTLMILATYANRDGLNAFPSVTRLAEECRCTARAVKQRLARLRQAGYLVVQAPARQHHATTYRVVVPKASRGAPQFTPEGPSEVNGDAPLGTVRSAPGFTPDGPSEVNGDASLEPVRGESTAVRGEPTGAPGVNGGSPDLYRDQSIDQKDRSAAAPRFSAQAREPNGNGNYRVIHRLAMELLHQQQIASESDLIDAVKWTCAKRNIDYGAHPDVKTHVVARACASAWMKARPTASQRATGLSRHPGRTGPPPPSKYDRVPDE